MPDDSTPGWSSQDTVESAPQESVPSPLSVCTPSIRAGAQPRQVGPDSNANEGVSTQSRLAEPSPPKRTVPSSNSAQPSQTVPRGRAPSRHTLPSNEDRTLRRKSPGPVLLYCTTRTPEDPNITSTNGASPRARLRPLSLPLPRRSSGAATPGPSGSSVPPQRASQPAERHPLALSAQLPPESSMPEFWSVVIDKLGRSSSPRNPTDSPSVSKAATAGGDASVPQRLGSESAQPGQPQSLPTRSGPRPTAHRPPLSSGKLLPRFLDDFWPAPSRTPPDARHSPVNLPRESGGDPSEAKPAEDVGGIAPKRKYEDEDDQGRRLDQL